MAFFGFNQSLSFATAGQGNDDSGNEIANQVRGGWQSLRSSSRLRPCLQAGRVTLAGGSKIAQVSKQNASQVGLPTTRDNFARLVTANIVNTMETAKKLSLGTGGPEFEPRISHPCFDFFPFRVAK